ncbi:helix-turn-helix domain-containing protein [Candidatus Zixiibacteriota bacterium]
MADKFDLGRKIHRLRKEKLLTLKQLSEMSNVTATHISELERGLASPTINTLYRIAQALRKPAAYFLPTEEEKCYHITTEKNRKRISRNGYELEFICSDMNDARLVVVNVKFDGEVTLHPLGYVGDEKMFSVQRGKVEVELNGNTIQMEKGDSLQITEGLPSRARSIGKGGAEALLVLTAAFHVDPKKFKFKSS